MKTFYKTSKKTLKSKYNKVHHLMEDLERSYKHTPFIPNEYRDVVHNYSQKTGMLYLNKLNKNNQLDEHFIYEIYNALLYHEHQPQINYSILSTYNRDIFSNGTPIGRLLLKSKQLGDEYLDSYYNQLYGFQKYCASYSKPLIVNLKGKAKGSGAAMALSFPFILSDTNTRVSFNECKYGYIPDGGSLYYLSRLPGNLGSFIALTGYILNDKDLANLKMIDGIHPGIDEFLKKELPTSDGYYLKKNKFLKEEEDVTLKDIFKLNPFFDVRNKDNGIINTSETYKLAKDVLLEKTNNTTETEQFKEKSNINYTFHLELFYDSIFKPYYLDSNECQDNMNFKKTMIIDSYLNIINRCFRFDSISDIKLALQQELTENKYNSEFINNTLHKLECASEESLTLTHYILKKAKTLDYSSILKLEAAAAKNLILLNKDIENTIGKNNNEIENYYRSIKTKNSLESILDKYLSNLDKSKITLANNLLLPIRNYYKLYPDTFLYYINDKYDSTNLIEFNDDKEVDTFIKDHFDIDMKENEFSKEEFKKLISEIKKKLKEKELLEEKIATLNGNKNLIDNFFLKCEEEIDKLSEQNDIKKITDIYNSFYEEFLKNISIECEKLSFFEKKRFFISLKKYLFISILERSRNSSEKKVQELERRNQIKNINTKIENNQILKSFISQIDSDIDDVLNSNKDENNEKENINEFLTINLIKEKIEKIENILLNENENKNILTIAFEKNKLKIEQQLELFIKDKLELLTVKIELLSIIIHNNKNIDYVEKSIQDIEKELDNFLDIIKKLRKVKNMSTEFNNLLKIKGNLKEMKNSYSNQNSKMTNIILEIIENNKENSESTNLSYLLLSLNKYLSRNNNLDDKIKKDISDLITVKNVNDMVENSIQTSDININCHVFNTKYLNIYDENSFEYISNIFNRFNKNKLLVEILSEVKKDDDSNSINLDKTINLLSDKIFEKKDEFENLLTIYLNHNLNSNKIKIQYLLSSKNNLYLKNKDLLEEYEDLCSIKKSLEMNDKNLLNINKIINQVESYINSVKFNIENNSQNNNNFEDAKLLFNIPQNYEETKFYKLLDCENKTITSLLNDSDKKLINDYLFYQENYDHILSKRIPMDLINTAISVFEAKIIKVVKLFFIYANKESNIILNNSLNDSKIIEIFSSIINKIKVNLEKNDEIILDDDKYKEEKNFKADMIKSIFTDLFSKFNNLKDESKIMTIENLNEMNNNEEGKYLLNSLISLIPKPKFINKFFVMEYISDYYIGNKRIEYENSFEETIEKIMDIGFISEIHKLKKDYREIYQEIKDYEKKNFFPLSPAYLLKTFYLNHSENFKKILEEKINNWDYSDFIYETRDYSLFDDNKGFYIKKDKKYPETSKKLTSIYHFMKKNVFKSRQNLDEINSQLNYYYKREARFIRLIQSNKSNYKHWKEDVEKEVLDKKATKKEVKEMMEKVDKMINYYHLKHKKRQLIEKISSVESLARERNININLKEDLLKDYSKELENFDNEINKLEKKARKVFNKKEIFEFKEFQIGSLLNLETIIFNFLKKEIDNKNDENVNLEIINEDTPYKLYYIHNKINKQITKLSNNFIDIDLCPKKYIDNIYEKVMRNLFFNLEETQKKLNKNEILEINSEIIENFINSNIKIKDLIKDEIKKIRYEVYSNFDKVNNTYFNKNNNSIQNKHKNNIDNYYSHINTDEILLNISREARLMKEFKESTDDDRLVNFIKFKNEPKRNFIIKSLKDFKCDSTYNDRVIEDFIQNQNSRVNNSILNSNEIESLYFDKKQEKEIYENVENILLSEKLKFLKNNKL